jgi:hypothetical protein
VFQNRVLRRMEIEREKERERERNYLVLSISDFNSYFHCKRI